MMKAYKFSSTATAIKPDNETTRLLEKAMETRRLSREEKDRIGEVLYGLFGSQSSTYKLSGWAWSMYGYLPRILVRFIYDNHFQVYYAPDKTSLRKALSSPIKEMVYA